MYIHVCRKGVLVKTATKTTTDCSKGFEVTMVKDEDGRRRVRICAQVNAWNLQVCWISLLLSVLNYRRLAVQNDWSTVQCDMNFAVTALSPSLVPSLCFSLPPTLCETLFLRDCVGRPCSLSTRHIIFMPHQSLALFPSLSHAGMHAYSLSVRLYLSLSLSRALSFPYPLARLCARSLAPSLPRSLMRTLLIPNHQNSLCDS